MKYIISTFVFLSLWFFNLPILSAATSPVVSDSSSASVQNGLSASFSNVNMETATSANTYSHLGSDFVRKSGFVLRPELDREVSLKAGYQFNPFFQAYGGVGYDTYLKGLGFSLGARAYTNEGKWAAVFDLRLGYMPAGALSSSLMAGASYKNFDFGVGGTFYTDGRFYLIVPTLIAGYNIRFGRSSSSHSSSYSRPSHRTSYRSSYRGSGFTRGSGFFLRPELDREVALRLGYQFNPYFQTYGGVGYDVFLKDVGFSAGVRAYTNDNKWAAMFDLRLDALISTVFSASLVAGAAYKDFDFGVGGTYYTDGSYYLIAPMLVVGYNIRCYSHR